MVGLNAKRSRSSGAQLALLALLTALACLVGCGGGDQAGRVQEMSGDGWQPSPLALASASGERDGAAVQAGYQFTGPGGGSLKMTVHARLEPNPVFESGEWSYDGPTGTAEGLIRPEKLRFLGGQGEPPSLGGVFVLEEAGADRFRVNLPPTGLGGGFRR